MPSAAAASNWTYSKRASSRVSTKQASPDGASTSVNRRVGSGSGRLNDDGADSELQDILGKWTATSQTPSGSASAPASRRGSQRTYPFLPSAQANRDIDTAQKPGTRRPEASAYDTDSPLGAVLKGDQDDGQWTAGLHSSTSGTQRQPPQRSLSFALHDVSSLLGLSSSASPTRPQPLEEPQAHASQSQSQPRRTRENKRQPLPKRKGAPVRSTTQSRGPNDRHAAARQNPVNPAIASARETLANVRKNRPRHQAQSRRVMYNANGRRVRVAKPTTHRRAKPTASKVKQPRGGRSLGATLSPGPGPRTPGATGVADAGNARSLQSADRRNPVIDRELDTYLHTTSELNACSDSMVQFIEELRE